MSQHLKECLNLYFEDIEAWVMATEDFDTIDSIMNDYEHRAENALWVDMVVENMIISDGSKCRAENEQLVEILTVLYRTWCENK